MISLANFAASIAAHTIHKGLDAPNEVVLEIAWHHASRVLIAHTRGGPDSCWKEFKLRLHDGMAIM